MSTDAKRESGWVIERYMHSVLCYWTGQAFNLAAINSPGSFDNDPNKALRFARAEDATIILARLLDGNGRVAEHIWGLT